MSSEVLDQFRHEHVFLGAQHERNERRTWAVIVLTTVMMVIEIGGGMMFKSMALLADGFHMSTHAGAMLIAAFAYTYARKHARDPRFSFGTGKVGELAAFASAIVLAVVSLLIGYESAIRLFNPVPIAFDEALPVAVLGLVVNIVSAWLLAGDHGHVPGHSHAHGEHDHLDHDHEQGRGHDHAHDHHAHDHHAHEHEHDHDHEHDHEHARGFVPAPGHGRDHGHQHHDLNLRAAYVHVLADAAVSVLAIVGLLAGRQLGWVWMDPLMGIVGFVVIAKWSLDLLRAAGAVLLDMRPQEGLMKRITSRLEAGGDHVVDLHVWRLGPGHSAAVVSLVSTRPLSPAAYKTRLEDIRELSHVTIEVQPWPGG
jgi:cation diffusion facilitator family transporter